MPTLTIPHNESLDGIHHIAVYVTDLASTVDWYLAQFKCEIRYRDDTWALVEFGNIYMAFVSQGQHPPHIGFVRPDAERFGELKPHRDGTRSVYVKDPSGNAVEILAQD